jgi:ABC-2 type transport system permease protein
MLRTLKIYPALLRAYWHRSIIYRAAYIVWIVNTAFPLVMMAIWISLAQGGPIQGYSATDFVGYYLAAILVRRITNCGIVGDLENLVRTGELSVYLLRPVNVVHHFVARMLSSRLIGIPLIGIPVLIAVLLTPGTQFNFQPVNLMLFILASATGFIFEFLAQYLIGGLSFWITQAHGVSAAYQLARSFLGGYIVPLAMFPASLQGALYLLPFQVSMALPVELLTGRMTPEVALLRLGVCVVWIAVLALCTRLLWRAGLRSYSAVGA